MAYELHRPGLSLPFVAASAVLPRTAVKLAGTSVPFVLPVATSTEEPLGYVRATAGASGLNSQDVVAVYEEQNIVKAVAAASLGAGADVTIGSSNGALVPHTVGASSTVWSHGKALTAAAAGEVFSLYVRPRRG